jgi:YD repeat-containing protein
MRATKFLYHTLLLTALLLSLLSGVVNAEDPQSPTTLPTVNVPGQSDLGIGDSTGGFVDYGSILKSINPGSFMWDNRSTTTAPYKNKNGNGDVAGEPIEVSTGAKIGTYTDFAVPGEMGLKFVRYYNTAAYPKWSNNFEYSLDNTCEESDTKCHLVTVYCPDGSTMVFGGNPTTPGTVAEKDNGLALLTLNADGTYTVQDEDTLTEVFSAAGQIQSIKDASGIGWTFTYPSGVTAAGRMPSRVTHTNGQYISISLQGTVTTVTDPAGNAYTYGGDIASYADINSVTLPGSPATVISYEYNTADYLTEVDYNGAPYGYTTYTNAGFAPNLANSTYLADGSETVSINYAVSSNGFLTTAIITNALGDVTTNQYNGGVGFDGANQLMSAAHAAVVDGPATTMSRTYDPNGNLSQLIDNNGNVHKFTYAANGQLQTETEAYGTAQARTTDYTWDPDAQLNRELSVTIEGWSKTIYTYNAQNRLASAAVTNLSGNGISGQTLTTTYNYTLYANGMVQTMSVTHPSPNNSDTDVTTYDALGNVTSVANGLGQTTTYSNYNGLGEVGTVVGPNGDTTSYTYDARGRVSKKTAYPNGTAAVWNYTYDGFGLLYTLTTPDNEVTTWNRNAEMRVVTITHNDKDGTSTETFGYNAAGDVTSHQVARGSTIGLSESTVYDALERPYQKLGMHGQVLTYGYDGNGNALSVVNAVGHTVSNQYDALDRLTQSTESGGASPLMPSTAPTLTAPATSSTGSYTVSWTTVSGALTYNLQKEMNGGAWASVQNTGSTSWSAASQPTGTYGYRVQACDATGCGPWSATGSTTVSIPTAPATAPALSVPANSTTGSYTVSWGSVSSAGSYTLQQRVNGGGWTTVSASAALSWNASGEASGSYGYQVQACNAVGCGPWSAVGTDTVTLPPIPATPSLTTPSTNATGSYTVSWNAVSNATSYTMQEQVNGGGWTTVSASAATSWAASVPNGTYGYRVQACDVTGCSAWSGTSTTVVTIPVPIAINGQSYQEGEQVGSGTGAARIGFAIAGGNTWEVFIANGNFTNTSVVVSGAVPATAVSVQYTWTLEGVPSGDLDSGGALTNGASSPTAISSNPSSQYTTAAFGPKSVARGETYLLTVTFFNAAGANVSSSTATMTATVVGSE